MPLVNTMHNYTVSDKKSGLEADGVFELTPLHLYELTFLKPFPNLLKRAVDDPLLDISVYETSADMISRMCVCVCQCGFKFIDLQSYLDKENNDLLPAPCHVSPHSSASLHVQSYN